MRSQRADNIFGMIGRSPAMQDLLAKIEILARKEVTVLIRGERGTGKELVANALHALSPRGDRAYQKINCAGFTPELLISELFGHERGAFTGAHQKRLGLLQAAHHGTIFLDEIGELPLSAQGILLRFIQEGEVRPLGSNYTVFVDARIISATNRNLEKEMTEGSFKEDLYDRLYEVTLFIPPLRERREDILPLIRHFLKIFNEKYDEQVKDFDQESWDFIGNYLFPGNVRELRNLIQRAVVFAQGKRILKFKDIKPQHQIQEKTSSLNSRQQAILQAIRDKKSVRFMDLTPLLETSRETLRQELNLLIKLGLLNKRGKEYTEALQK